MTLSEFMRKIPDFEQLAWPPTQLIPYFAYFLELDDASRTIQPRDVNSVFDEARVRRPGNTPAAMSASKGFVKVKGGGYRLEHRTREHLKASLLDESTTEESASAKIRPADLVMTDSVDKRVVFVVYGRDHRLRRDLFSLLRSMGLNPLEFDAMAHLTGSTSPSTWDVIQAGFAHAQACVVLFSPDELVTLRADLRSADDSDDDEFQSRPNVLLEAGMALALQPKRTIIVKVGKVRSVSDLDGIQYVNLTGSSESRNKLLNKLKLAGCDAKTHGDDWLNVGEFKVDLTGVTR
jgi:predicted nucleotide-binding protein